MNDAGTDKASLDAGAVEVPAEAVAVAEGDEAAAVDEASDASEAGEDAPASSVVPHGIGSLRWAHRVCQVGAASLEARSFSDIINNTRN